MLAPLDTALKVIQSIQWKHILILTGILMLLHVLVFENLTPTTVVNGAASEAPTSKATALNPAPTTQPASKPKVAFEPPTSFDFEPSLHTEPFLTAEPEDGNYELPPDSIPPDEYVAVCMSVKDQAKDMVEFFVHHYYNMGIKRFYVMDDGSDPPLSTFEYPGIPRTALTFTFQPRASRAGNMQTVFYGWCIEWYADKHTWIAFLDGDEFLETPGNETLNEVLESFVDDDTVGALGVNWRMHSSSGLLKRPESVRQSFVHCIYDDLEHNGTSSANAHIKSIVKTKYAEAAINPHKFATKGRNTVGEYSDVVTTAAWRRPITRTRIGLHHYAVKSREEYVEKMNRGNGMTDPKREAFWLEIENETPHVNCTEMRAYSP
ncbi:hypothetical protein EG329_006743 [Mollisiaceae sp. DMI_Dod_QoI]|nr:hypothetical protein EG329_006743 [Helotiales sp. DMI_Dod_QoI]